MNHSGALKKIKVILHIQYAWIAFTQNQLKIFLMVFHMVKELHGSTKPFSCLEGKFFRLVLNPISKNILLKTPNLKISSSIWMQLPSNLKSKMTS